MDKYTLLKRNQESEIIYLEDAPFEQTKIYNNDTYTTLYSPVQTNNKQMKILYLYNTNKNVDNCADYFSWDILSNDFKLISKMWVFPTWVSGLNIIQINVANSNKFKGLDTNYKPLNFWVFNNYKKVPQYVLVAIIWPPAYHIRDDIINDIHSNYKVLKSFNFKISKKRMLPFIKQVYRGDRRCDKSQLIHKYHNVCPNNGSTHFQIGFIKFLVGNLDLDQLRVSNTSIQIKDNIRNKYKKQISNYKHDIIIHISDNEAHSFDMERIVKHFK